MERLKEMNDEIISQIYFIRGRKVMFDSDLARLYGVTTARLNQQVRRNVPMADILMEGFPQEIQSPP